jgi:phosphopantetheinyl transferase/acyl carrier protein
MSVGNTVSNSPGTPAPLFEGCPPGLLPRSGRTAYCRLDAFPCAPGALADLILNPLEREHWTGMRAVEKRRHEWLLGRYAAKSSVRLLLKKHLGMQPSFPEIGIVPDPYGCPRVEGAWITADLQPSLSIAHSQGTAIALAALDPGVMVGIDLESLNHRRENYEAVAFSPDERSLLAGLPYELRQEWALRMWCAKESVGKALGRGLSAGLLAFHITGIESASGKVELELREGAIEQFPRLRGKSFTISTVRESSFVFSAMIYQQGVARMRPSRQEILDYLLHKMGELTQDWDYPDPVSAESLLFTELGFESLDAVVLCTAIQEHYHTAMPFAELLAEIGEQQRDLSINELADFVDTHLGKPAGVDSISGRIQ